MAREFGVPKLSTGDLLRDSVQKKTTLGLEAKGFMDRGELVPDEVVIGLVREKLRSAECQKGFLLDGFPRTVPQADQLELLLQSSGNSLDRVIYFTLPKDEIVKRISGRRSCPRCKAVYHIQAIPPKKNGICDVCETELIQRNDDKPETIESRLSVYDEQTAPLIEYYKGKNVLSELDGSGPVDDVQRRLLALLS
ncbi:MAG: adenylate kinase [Nitrospirales bacterium]|nr:adenylate kinase [Nitrospirales bacterium]